MMDRWYPSGGYYRLDPGEIPGLGFVRETDHDAAVATLTAERDHARSIAAALEEKYNALVELVVLFAHSNTQESAIWLDAFLDGAILAEAPDPDAPRTPWPHPDAEVSP